MIKLQTERVILVLALVCIVAIAVPVPTLDVPALTRESDVVVVGMVQSAQDTGATTVEIQGRSVSARVILCQMKVDGVLKGVVYGQKLSFQYDLPDQPIGYASVAAPSYQIVFLKRFERTYSLASPYHASLPAIPVPHAVRSDPLSNIVTRLGDLIESAAASVSQKEMALYALSTIPTPQSALVLQAGLQQQVPELRLNAAGFLLQRNDLSGLKLAEFALVHPDADVPKYVLHNLAYAISEGLKDEQAVPTLDRLMNSQDAETRRGAASALRHTRSRSALGPLARSLSDADSEVRYDAVIGLAEITGQSDWAPNMDLFQSQEEKYMSHWHDWASANGLLK